MQLYSVRRITIGHRIVKWDEDFTVLSINAVFDSKQPDGRRCTCPRGAYPVCRHVNIVAAFMHEQRVDKGWFFDYDTGKWIRPLNDPVTLLKQKIAREKTNETSVSS